MSPTNAYSRLYAHIVVYEYYRHFFPENNPITTLSIQQLQPQPLLPICSLYNLVSQHKFTLNWSATRLSGRQIRATNKVSASAALAPWEITPLSYTRWRESLQHERIIKRNAIKQVGEVHCVLRVLNARKSDVYTILSQSFLHNVSLSTLFHC